MKRFISNCRCKSVNRKRGPLRTEEIDEQRLWWIKAVQTKAKGLKFQADAVQLNIQPDANKILKCRGRIQ